MSDRRNKVWLGPIVWTSDRLVSLCSGEVISIRRMIHTLLSPTMLEDLGSRSIVIRHELTETLLVSCPMTACVFTYAEP